MLTSLAPLFALYVTAISLVGRQSSRAILSDKIFVGVLAVFGTIQALPMLLLLVFHTNAGNILSIFIGVLALMVLALPLTVLLKGYMKAKLEQRLRIKWILAGSALLLPLLITDIIEGVLPISDKRLSLSIMFVQSILGLLIFGIYAFAVLSTRLVDVRVVVNRAVVFAILMGLVVGLLALTENLFENSALHGRASLAPEVAASLGLGIAFDQIQRRIELVVDRLFFRREHKAREILKAFQRDCGFIEQSDELVNRVTAMFDDHTGGHGAVLYEARSTVFEKTAEHGRSWPPEINRDDPALVWLRATQAPLDLHGLESALGHEGVALPLALRGQIFGVLVCGPRGAARYAQAELTELAQVARDIGASLFALRARANEDFVEKLALGHVNQQDATNQARQLLGLTS
ncbi:MAG: hypothetical protein POH28_08150 [Acidocella sp.]|nr:hypothetical protein [Acidocella sp.]